METIIILCGSLIGCIIMFGVGVVGHKHINLIKEFLIWKKEKKPIIKIDELKMMKSLVGQFEEINKKIEKLYETKKNNR